MATGLTDSANYQAIADAIRLKTGGSETYQPNEMAAAIQSISTEIEVTAVDFTYWADGSFTVTKDGEDLSGTVTFDSANRPTSITLNGHTLTLTLPEVE